MRSDRFRRERKEAEIGEEEEEIADSLSDRLYPRQDDPSDLMFTPTHSLLSPELLDIKEDLDIQACTHEQGIGTDEGVAGGNDKSTSDIVSAFGILSISEW